MAYKNKFPVKKLDLAEISSKIKVGFLDIKERYSPNEDLVVKYVLHDYKQQECDRIVIFKMGWTSLKEYVLFEWTTDYETDTPYVIFKKSDLPRNPQDSDDLYQFCYITYENTVYGVSTPFQICASSSENMSLPGSHNSATSSRYSTTSSMSLGSIKSDSSEYLKDVVASKDQEIAKLREENLILKESLKSVIEERQLQSKTKVNYEEELKNVVYLMERLSSSYMKQQKQIDEMRAEIKKSKQDFKKFCLQNLPAKTEEQQVEKNTVPEGKSSGSIVPEGESKINTVPEGKSSGSIVPEGESKKNTAPEKGSEENIVPEVDSKTSIRPAPENARRCIDLSFDLDDLKEIPPFPLLMK